MKKLLAMFLLVPTLVLAEPKKATYETICLNGEDLTDTINSFNELPFVRGLSLPLNSQETKLSLVIFANPTTGTFTIVERADTDLYCILSVGGGFEPVPKEMQDNVRQEQEKGSL